MSHIELHGVRVHNLQNLDLRLPLGKLIAVTGVSGAGKSSLAFDTLVAEGRRRYIETFSPSARHHLERIERPDFDAIDNLPPAVAFRAETPFDERATLGTLTEADNLLQILFARVGQVFCPQCNARLFAQTPDEVCQELLSLSTGTKFVIAFPVEAVTPSELESWRQQGFVRVLQIQRNKDVQVGLTATSINLSDKNLEGKPVDVNSVVDSKAENWIVVDRLIAGNKVAGEAVAENTESSRVLDGIEQAFHLSGGKCLVLADAPLPNRSHHFCDWEGKPWQVSLFSASFVCFDCREEFPSLETESFSFESPIGACAECSGFGVTKLEERSQICGACGGSRMKPFARSVRLGSVDQASANLQSIVQLRESSIQELAAFIERIQDTLSAEQRTLITSVAKELSARLRTLIDLGLSYLALGRSVRTLSRGERQRARLAGLLAVRLDNAMYVLDEPMAGLHPSEQPRVLEALRRLQRAGNTVIVVEHQRVLIEAADEVVDLGPGAGRSGGCLVFQGPPSELPKCSDSATGSFLAEATSVTLAQSQAKKEASRSTGVLRLEGVTIHNLQNFSVEIPLGVLCVVTGVSGSGKSSLIKHTLWPALCQRLGMPCDVTLVGQFKSLSGVEHISDVLFVDSSNLGRSTRANAATSLLIFGEIRRLFAQTTEAKVRNFSARHFSFNALDGGRCLRCKGLGAVEIEMDFLADLSVVCPECHGSRFQKELLEAKLRGLSIAEVLLLTADEAFVFFRGHPKLQRRLKCLKDVGLGYLPLGQSITTLSRGESQRLKLATFLTSSSRSRTLFLMDEPTAGLHPADVKVLTTCLRRMTDVGHSLVVIEHRPEFIREADCHIELTPRLHRDFCGPTSSAVP